MKPLIYIFCLFIAKWKTKYGNDIRLKNVEEIVQDTNLIVKKILSKLDDQEENCEEDHTLPLFSYTLISLVALPVTEF